MQLITKYWVTRLERTLQVLVKQSLPLLMASVVSVFFLAPTSWAGSWSASEQLSPAEITTLKQSIVDGDTQAVYQLLKESIYNGEVTPQFLMGLTHEQAKNYKNAVDWYQISAQGEGANAMYRLGMSYEHGSLGLKQNYTLAYKYYEKASMRGYSKAQFKLARIYEKGLLGANRSLPKAFAWYKQAAEQGMPLAQYAVGNMYDSGDGVGKQTARAYHWYQKAADSGLAVAQYKLGALYHHSPSIASDGVEPTEKAYYWLEKAAQQGLAEAQLELGLMFEEGQISEEGKAIVSGEEVTPQYERASYWYTKAAEQGNADGQMALGTFYMMGWGVDQDFKAAQKWLTRSSKQGNQTANTWLALIKENASPTIQENNTNNMDETKTASLQ
jgi:hypothetical protein